MGVFLQLFPCQKRCHQPNMCSWMILLMGSHFLLAMCVQLLPKFMHQSRIRPSGSTRWHLWWKRNRCRCVSSPESELFLCSSNWLFATNVFCNEGVFWAGGSDPWALSQSEFNKLLGICTRIRVGPGVLQTQAYCPRMLQISAEFIYDHMKDSFFATLCPYPHQLPEAALLSQICIGLLSWSTGTSKSCPGPAGSHPWSRGIFRYRKVAVAALYCIGW